MADFFHFYGFGYDWYVFNIADLAITLGAAAIIYDVLKPEHGQHGHAHQGHEPDKDRSATDTPEGQ